MSESTITSEGRIWDAGRRILSADEARVGEYRAAIRFFEPSAKVLDVACGTGTFLELRPNTVGIDINPENVDYCRARGLPASVGDALALDFPASTFDGVHCSHLIQVFSPEQTVKAFTEIARVVRPGGTIVITTLNSFKRFFRHPENVRPYPPDAIMRLIGKAKGSQSPMFPGLPVLAIEDVVFRRPALVEFYGSTPSRARYSAVLNSLQRQNHLRKYWSFDAYTMKLRVHK